MRTNKVNSKPSQRWYRGADIPMRVIRQFARDIVKRFRPDKIVLFGSYAYGTPHQDSDVDLLVVMPARNTTDMAIKIQLTVPPSFPVDLIVRTPKEMAWRLAERESFLTELLSKGKTLYEKDDQRVDQESRGRLAHGRVLSGGKHRHHDGVCFHGQQAAEKYLKALLEELGATIPKTHNLVDLQNALSGHFASLAKLQRGLVFLKQFAVEFRYPGKDATLRQAKAALRWTGRIRSACRALLGLS